MKTIYVNKLRNTTLFALVFFCISAPSEAYAARLWSSGCEFQGDSPGNATAALEFQNVQGTSADSSQISASTKRSGLSSCASIRATSGWSSYYHEFLSTALPGPFYFRTYLYIDTMPAEDAEIIVYENADDNRSALVLNSDGTLDIRSSDDSTILDSDATVLSTGVWYRIEYKYDDNATVEVRLDGVEVLNASADGANVQAMRFGLCATGGVAGVACGGDFLTTGTLYFDDIALNDTSGAAQTSWPGAGSIVHMQPDGTAGDNNGASSGNCASVDEVTPDGASTLAVLDANSDILDCMAESPAEAGIDEYDTVTLVQVGVRESAVSAASESWNMRIKSATAGTVTSGSTVAHDDTTYLTNGDVPPRNYSLTSYTDPSTGVAWTPIGTSSLDKMQIGINAVDATPDINVSTLWALVEYVDGSIPAALTRYSLTGEALNANTNPISATTELFTAPADSLLVVLVGTDSENIDVQDGMSISGGGLTWTRRVGPTGYTSGGFYGAHEIFTAPVTSATELNLTISHTGNCGTDCWISTQVLAYTGYNGASPIGGTASDGLLATNGADSITLSATPATESDVVATRFAVPSGSTDTFATEGAGWTELFDIRTSDFGASGYGGLQTQVRGSSVSTAVDWVDTNVGNVALGFSSGLALEIKSTYAPQPPSVTSRFNFKSARFVLKGGGRFLLRSQ